MSNTRVKLQVTSTRSKQRGYAEGLVPLMTLIVYGFLGLLFLAICASLFVPLAWLRGRWRIAALVCVLAFWVHLYLDKIKAPEDRTKWRLAGWKQCETELKQLPTSLIVDGFLDEGGALRKAALLQLFAERRLEFVEVRIPQDGASAGRIGYPDGDQESGWTLKNPKTPYVRLQLGRKGDPACADLPMGLRERVDRPPFLPDTCITTTFLDVPTARYALSLRPSASPDPQQYGAWALVDRKTAEHVITLTTIDTVESVSSGGRGLSKPGRPLDGDCRSPHSVIVDRLVGPEAQQQQSDRQQPQVLSLKQVAAQIDVATIDQSPVPDLQSVAESATYNEQTEWALFGPEIRQSEWDSTVKVAYQNGFASYGRQLLDLQRRRLISLIPTAKENPYPWHVFAVNNGFLVLSSSPGWYESASNLIVRYSHDGTFSWAARIAKPSSRTTACSRFSPQAVYTTDDHLVFADRCIKLSSDSTRGEIWKVPLRALPGNL